MNYARPKRVCKELKKHLRCSSRRRLSTETHKRWSRAAYAALRRAPDDTVCVPATDVGEEGRIQVPACLGKRECVAKSTRCHGGIQEREMECHKSQKQH